MKVDVYVMIMVGLAIGMYFVGYTSPLLAWASGENGLEDISLSTLLDNMKNAILSPLGIATLGIIGGFAILPMIGGGASYSTGSILAFFIPVLLIYAIANFLFFPIVPYAQAEIGFQPLSLLVTVIFNLMLTLTILEFVSGR